VLVKTWTAETEMIESSSEVMNVTIDDWGFLGKTIVADATPNETPWFKF
jgi:hypothetical protein